MLYNLLPKFKVVEINNVAALRIGHLIAQVPAKVNEVPTRVEGDYKFLENGAIVGLDRSGYLKSFVAAEHVQPCLVYNEELITADFTGGLDQFAEQFDEEGVVYPRALPLNIGDVFTTNNVKDNDYKNGYAKVVDGVIVIDEEYTAGTHMFIAKKSDLPAGQEAVELTYIGLVAAAANGE